MKRFVAIVVAVLALAAATTASAAKDFPDTPGDQGIGTDIVNTNVSNDASGLISFKIGTGTPLIGNHLLYLLIDSDKNTGTGDPSDGYGFDVLMLATPDALLYLSWNGSDFVAGQPPSFRTSRAGTTFEFAINRSDMGNTRGFRFAVLSLSLDGDKVNFWDEAPDGSTLYEYNLDIAQCANGADDDADGKIDGADLGCSSATDNNEADDPVTIKVLKPKPQLAPVQAGAVTTIGAATRRIETGQPLDAGSVKCRAKVAGATATLRGSGIVSNGRAQCNLRIPASAAGKIVTGEMTVVYKGKTAKAPFTFRVAK